VAAPRRVSQPHGVKIGRRVSTRANKRAGRAEGETAARMQGLPPGVPPAVRCSPYRRQLQQPPQLAGFSRALWRHTIRHTSRNAPAGATRLVIDGLQSQSRFATRAVRCLSGGPPARFEGSTPRLGGNRPGPRHPLPGQPGSPWVARSPGGSAALGGWETTIGGEAGAVWGIA
jgi:hypothetical protein